MKIANKLTGMALATAAAAMFTTAPMTASAAESDTGHCYGVNACKGQAACATANNACKGHNSCKGQGWMPMSKEDCDAQGGKYESE